MSEENKDAATEAAGQATPAGEGSGGASAAKLDSFDGEASAAGQSAQEAAGEENQADAPADPAVLQARIAKLEADLTAKEDQHLRAVAEVQNIRRRAERDRRDAEQYGGTKLARDILPVFDNLDEALRQASDALKETEAGFFNGVELTQKVLLDALSKNQISQIKPDVGEKFDPNQHQAMFEAPVPGAEPGSIIQVMQSGFMISDRLLRPAMVGVASAASGAAPAGTDDENTAASV